MQKKILGVVFIGLLLGVALVLYGLLLPSHAIVTPKNNEAYPPATVTSTTSTPARSTWIEDLAKKESGEFVFPVNELLIHIDSPKVNIAMEKSYRLIIEDPSRYSLFCVFQTLTSLKLPYVVIKEEKNPLIYIQGKDQAFLESIVFELLKKHDIKSKIVEVAL